MRIPQLSAFLVAAALATAPSATAFADPVARAPISVVTTTTGDAPAASATTDAEKYAAREAKDTAVTKFKGGSETLVIGASSLGIILLVIIIVILL